MAPKSKKIHKKQKINRVEDINFESASCPICCSVLIEPVTLPCGHHFCLNCFNQTVNNASLCCPLCRTRISSWLRVARKENTLIDEPFWNLVKTKFSSYVDLKLNGGDDNFDKNLPQAPRILATPGEIKQEYEKQRDTEYKEILKERRDEETKSRELILKLQEQDQQAKLLEQQKLKEDEELARKLAEEERLATLAKSKEAITPKSRFSKGPMDAFLQSSEKKKLNKSRVLLLDTFPKNEIRKNIFPPGLPLTSRKQFLLDDNVDYMTRLLDTENDNTIDQEITHIKPITLVPKTPPKFDKNGKTLENSIIRTTPIRLIRENVEYHSVKSPNTNLIAEHHSDNISAFKSISPPKMDTADTDKAADTIKRLIVFNDTDSNPSFPDSPRTNTSIGSPFRGFSHSTLNNEFTKFTKLLNSHFPNNSFNTTSCDNNFKSDESLEESVIISEQKRLEKILIQEREDYELARKLFEELNAPETNKKYSLRAVRADNRRVQTRKRQSTMQEMCSQKKLKIQ